jgi:hypothetical protein
MEIVKRLLTIENLSELLDRSFSEFSISSQIDRNMMRSRYEVAIQESKIWTVEIYNTTDLIASAIVCLEDFPFEGDLLKISFLSQVIVQKEYRGLGFLNLIISSISEVDCLLECQASIVIARKAVGNMYYKYGYKGFGIFPELKIEKNNRSSISYNKNLIDKSLLQPISNAYKSTYWNLPGSTLRSEAKWLSIINEVQNGMLEIICEQLGDDICYAIIKNGKVIELAFTSEFLLEKILTNQQLLAVKIFKLASNHPAFKTLVKSGGLYTVRPEPFEGHMIRSYRESEIMRKFLKQNVAQLLTTKDIQNPFSIEIPELSQW